MKKYLFLFIASLFLASVAFAADSQIWDAMRVQNILAYGQEESLKLGVLFTTLQSSWFYKIFLLILVGVPTAFFVHYLVIGAKVFPHTGEKIFVFSLFKRVVHLFAAIALTVLIVTGLMVAFGGYFGGGTLVMKMRNLHGVATILFSISIIPMFVFWFLDMLPTFDDVKWVFMMGGYLSKEIKEIPASKFNAGQKMWFWLATLGGFVMIATGGVMYFQDFDLGIARSLGLTQIDLLRVSAIAHNVLAFAILAFFITHVYMALVAVKGAIYSMITGYKEHDEVKYLHSSWYKQLKKEGKV